MKNTTLHILSWTVCCLCGLTTTVLGAQIAMTDSMEVPIIKEVFRYSDFKSIPGGFGAGWSSAAERDRVMMEALGSAFPEDIGTERQNIIDSIPPNEGREYITSRIHVRNAEKQGQKICYSVVPVSYYSCVAGHFGVFQDSGKAALNREYHFVLNPASTALGALTSPEISDSIKQLLLCNVPFFWLENYIRDSVSYTDTVTVLPDRIVSAFLSKYRYLPDVQKAVLRPIRNDSDGSRTYSLHIDCVFGNSVHLELIKLSGILRMHPRGTWITKIQLEGTSDISTNLNGLSTSGVGKYSILFERQ